MTGERIYDSLPVVLQHAACSAMGLGIEHLRLGRAFNAELNEARERAEWSADHVIAYRDSRVADFARQAAARVPFYRARFAAAGIDPDRIRGLDDLRPLPLLTKDEARSLGPRLWSTGESRFQTVRVHTSGTTGSGLHVNTTRRAIRAQWATWWRYREWHGVRRGTACGYFGGRSIVPLSQRRPPYWRYNAPSRQIMFSAYHLSAETAPDYVSELRRTRVPWLHGYPSMLALLAGFIVEGGLDLGYAPSWITTGAENLIGRQADLIQQAFGRRPRQHYGMVEAVANVSECERGSLHVDEDFAATEFVAPAPGEPKAVVGTNFTNPAMPLLRYSVSDLARPVSGDAASGGCRCGRPGRIVHSIDGRAEDYVVLRNGAHVGRLDHIFKDMLNIREAQIRQEKLGEVTILVAPTRSFSLQDEAELIAQAKRRLGDTRVEVERVEAVPRSATGKLRLVISNVARG